MPKSKWTHDGAKDGWVRNDNEFVPNIALAALRGDPDEDRMCALDRIIEDIRTERSSENLVGEKLRSALLDKVLANSKVEGGADNGRN